MVNDTQVWTVIGGTLFLLSAILVTVTFTVTIAMRSLGNKIDGVAGKLIERIDGVEGKLIERIGRVEDRLTRVEERLGDVEREVGQLTQWYYRDHPHAS